MERMRGHFPKARDKGRGGREQQTGSSAGQGLKSDQRPALVSAQGQRGRKSRHNNEKRQKKAYLLCFFFFFLESPAGPEKQLAGERLQYESLWVKRTSSFHTNSYKWHELNEVSRWK